MYERNIPVRQRASSSLWASLHERLSGTVGTKELAELQHRLSAGAADIEDVLLHNELDDEDTETLSRVVVDLLKEEDA